MAAPVFKKSRKYGTNGQASDAEAVDWEYIKTKARLPKYISAVARTPALRQHARSCHQTKDAARSGRRDDFFMENAGNVETSH
jgi:hypothetical protein